MPVKPWKATTKLTPEVAEELLDEYYENGGHIIQACRTLGVAKATVDYHRRHNAKFAREWKECDEQMMLELAEKREAAVAKYERDQKRTGSKLGGSIEANNRRRGYSMLNNGAWKEPFLRVLSINGCVSHACMAAGISTQRAYRERQRDEDFALEWNDAVEYSTEGLEAEGIRRALNVSDLLLMFFLKARKPHMYRENAQIWRDDLNEQQLASLVDAVKNAATTTGLATDQFDEFTAELENELRKFEANHR